MTSSLFYVGQRLSYNGDLCTVRFIGNLQGTSGEWLGVEWDRPERGKHAGEYNGVKYFECVRKHATSASFVRLNRPHDSPRTFTEALRDKYASETGYNIQDQKATRISGKEVKEVGFEKIRLQLARLQELRVVILDGMRISQPHARQILSDEIAKSADNETIYSLKEVKNTCPNVVELDLSRNLFEDLCEILSICEQLQKLTSIRINGNRFRRTSLSHQERAHYIPSFRKIETLSLEDTLIAWQEVAELATLFPNLSSLSVSDNAFTRLTDLHATLPMSLTVITLEDNNFHAISDVEILTKLPKLRKLGLKANRISTVRANHQPTGSAGSLLFSPSLVELDISYNAISSWMVVDELPDVFPGMTSLRISHNPLYYDLQSPSGKALTADDGYMLTIARLGQLNTLNYSTISKKERLNAEIYYLSQIGLELSLSPPNAEASILSKHRRYADLCAEYGSPTVHRTTSGINPNALVARLITVTFHLSPRAASDAHRRVAPYTVEIPRSFTIYSVLGLAGKHFDLPPWRLRLMWETGELETVSQATHDRCTPWDSDSDGGQDAMTEGSAPGRRLQREVELAAGTRILGTLVEGRDATIRVELR